MESDAPGGGAVDRRRLLTGLAAGAGLTMLPSGLIAAAGDGAPAAAEIAPVPARSGWSPYAWTSYFGAVRQAPAWACAQRAGDFTGRAGRINIDKLRGHLRHDHLVSQAPPCPPHTLAGIKEFMNKVRATDGSWWRQRTYLFTRDLITAHKTTPHKVLAIQLGNEVNAVGYHDKIKAWARGRGLPFPHPRSNYGDDTWYRRDHIGYYVEYFLAPAMQAVRVANGRALSRHKIPIMLGSLIGVRDGFVRNQFLTALLDYEIGGAYAPDLAGMRVRDLVHFLSIHYLLTPEDLFGYKDDDGDPMPYAYRHALDDLHERWVGKSKIRGIWNTEEGGKQVQMDDRHASMALRVFGRTMSWALDRRVPPGQIKVFGHYAPPPGGWRNYQPRHKTSWKFAMWKLHDFLGHRTHLANRSSGVSVQVTDPVEKYAFETGDRERRVVLVTPQTAHWQGATTVRAVSIRADGWRARGSRIAAMAHLFKSDAEGYRKFRVTIRKSQDGRRYNITLPYSISLNANDDMQVLMINLRHPS